MPGLASAVLFAVALPMGASAQELDAGKAVFARNCMVCHQANGQGQDGLAPALTSYPARYAQTDTGRKLLGSIVLYGMVGAIENGGKQYNGNMPGFRTLSDGELADVLNYVAIGLHGSGSAESKPFSADEVKAQRTKAVTPSEVRHQRQDVLKDVGL
ncbi:hypothetical protein RM96_22055 [Cupriavidus sp. IDO]|nr:hypothetical protein RM96_22055 [Cupriavidus sp. IDO]